MTLNQNLVISVVKYPIVTEKTIQLLQRNQYSFMVDKKADKTTIKAAVEELFDVKVVSVNTLLTPVKKRRVGKFAGKKPQHKKAIVTLDSQSSITFFDE